MMRRLTEELDRAFGGGFGLWPSFVETGWAPPREVRERNGKLEAIAELPGLNQEDAKVECNQGGIAIQGEKRREKESDEGGVQRSERVYGGLSPDFAARWRRGR
jgi:HSP20 family molecular chaperone IbpA